MLVIGVAGGSGSGKTTFVNLLKENLQESHIKVLKHDAYYRPLHHMTFEERAKVNYDHPDSLDSNLFVQHIMALKNGHPAEVPEYDFSLHTRKPEALLIEPPAVLIVEGILIFVEKRIRDLCDMKIFIDTDDDDRILRRIKRDMESRGRDLNSIVAQYQNTVKPMHLEFVEPSKRWADLIIPRGGKNFVGLDLVSRKIHMLVKMDYPERLHTPTSG